MKVVTPEGYTFVTKFQEDNSHKVLRSVDFFSIKFDEIFIDTVCWEPPAYLYFSFLYIYLYFIRNVLLKPMHYLNYSN